VPIIARDETTGLCGDRSTVENLLRGINKCNQFGFEEGHPIREALRDLLRIHGPAFKKRIKQLRDERDARNRKPIQLRLF
jgi:hypothetical protein